MGQMKNSVETFFNELGGLPFVDEGFRPELLLSVVAGVRRRCDPAAHKSLVDYLDPTNARALFERYGHCQTDEPSATEIQETEQKQISAAREEVISVRPDWIKLLGIPVNFRKLLDARVSVTSALIPQVIFLGEVAFTSPGTLAEILVHEHAHIWLNFLAETADLQSRDVKEVYKLPSGTGGKTVRGVLLAAHFAASAHSFHVGRPSGRDRAKYLHGYLSGCIGMLQGSKEITPMGLCVLANLERYLSGIMAAYET
jgi:hypothetical protein